MPFVVRRSWLLVQVRGSSFVVLGSRNDEQCTTNEERRTTNNERRTTKKPRMFCDEALDAIEPIVIHGSGIQEQLPGD
jgi:hypothetical protein